VIATLSVGDRANVSAHVVDVNSLCVFFLDEHESQRVVAEQMHLLGMF
jgi:hypothetical protein